MISLICSLSELRSKEVVNVENGDKLGFIDDVEFDVAAGKIAAFVIFGRKRFYGIFGKDKDIIITCEQIKLIGSDTVLVTLRSSDCANKTKTKKFVFENLLH